MKESSIEDREILAQGLNKVLADSYLLCIKTQVFHWNVIGPSFYSLHKMFEEQYNELFQAVDEIAERIRALNKFAPPYESWLSLTSLKESQDQSNYISEQHIIRELLANHHILIKTARKTLGQAQKAGDEPTADLLTARIKQHEKTVWMLDSFLNIYTGRT